MTHKPLPPGAFSTITWDGRAIFDINRFDRFRKKQEDKEAIINAMPLDKSPNQPISPTAERFIDRLNAMPLAERLRFIEAYNAYEPPALDCVETEETLP